MNRESRTEPLLGVGQQMSAESCDASDRLDGLLLLRPQISRSCYAVCETAQELKHATYMDLSWKGIHTLSEGVAALTALREINLTRNEMESISPTLCLLNRLESMLLDENYIGSLPYEFSRLSNLAHISISNNRLEHIPDVFGNMSRLTFLNFSKNFVSALPQSFSNLVALQEVDLSYNHLTLVPFGISQLTDLRILNLQYNQLTALPYTIGQLTRLSELRIGSDAELDERAPNFITKLPLSMANMSSLKVFEYKYNPIEFPRSSILASGVDTLRDFLRRFGYEQAPLNYNRIILIGLPRSGKTRLIKNIVHFGGLSPDGIRSYNPTSGIEICREPHELNYAEDSISVFLWEFGGHPHNRIYYPYFLSRESVIIYTWDCSQDPNLVDVHEWAAMICLFAPGAPVLVVGTRLDTVRPEDYGILESRVESIRDVLVSFQYSLNVVEYTFVSNHTGENIGKLRRLMGAAMVEHGTARRLYSNYFLQFSRVTDSYTRFQPAPIAPFSDITLNLQMYSPKMSVVDVLEKLHDLGMILWVDMDHLNDTIFCHPPYLIRLFSQIFQPEGLQFDLGFCPIESLLSMYENTFPGFSELAVSLLRRFQLSFSYVLGQYEVFPSYLTESTPHPSIWRWNPAAEESSFCTAELEFNFMPAIVFNSILCQLYPTFFHIFDHLPDNTDEHIASNAFVFKMSIDPENKDAASYHGLVMRAKDPNRFYVSARSLDPTQFSPFNCLQHLISRIIKAASHFRNILLQSRRLLCPHCSQIQPTFDACGFIPLDGSQIFSDEPIICWKEGVAHAAHDWVHGCFRADSILDLDTIDFDIPSVLQIESTPATMGNSASIIVHILCDQAGSPHRTDSLGILLSCAPSEERRSWLRFFLRLWKPKVASDKLHEFEDVDAKDLASWLVQKGSQPFRVPLSAGFVLALKAMDPNAEWKTILESVTLHDHQCRYLCRQCAAQSRSTWPTQWWQSKRAIAGYMLHRTDGFLQPWERRYFELDQERKCLMRYKDSSKTLHSGVIQLDSDYEIYHQNYGDDLAGFHVSSSKSSHHFRVKTMTERDAWVLNLKKCK